MEICNLLSMLLTVCVFKRVLYELDVSKKNFLMIQHSNHFVSNNLFAISFLWYLLLSILKCSAPDAFWYTTNYNWHSTNSQRKWSWCRNDLWSECNKIAASLKSRCSKVWLVHLQWVRLWWCISKRCRCAAKKQRITNCWSRFPTCLLTTKLPRARPSELLVVNVWYIFVLVLIVFLIVYF